MQAHDLICNGCSRASAAPIQCHQPNHHMVRLGTLFDLPTGDLLPIKTPRMDRARTPRDRLPTTCPVCQRRRLIDNNGTYAPSKQCTKCYRDKVKAIDTRRIGEHYIVRNL
jgi:hypothetical protein